MTALPRRAADRLPGGAVADRLLAVAGWPRRVGDDPRGIGLAGRAGNAAVGRLRPAGNFGQRCAVCSVRHPGCSVLAEAQSLAGAACGYARVDLH